MKLDTSIVRKVGNSPLFWIFIFVACVSLLAFQYILYYPDEVHYSDAALQMLRSHDWFTPRQASGLFRFKKPILSYWMIAASYRIFGVSVFSSRLPFLLCGIATILVVFKIAKNLVKDSRVALLAALITAANPLLVLSSARAIPDMPQTLFLTMAMLGFSGIITSEAPQKRDLWIMYLGFALAFLTKGILAAIFASFTLSFLLFNPWKKLKLKQLMCWPAVVVSLFVALWWYVLMYVVHSNEFIESFFGDQVGNRVSENPSRIMLNFVFSLITTPLYFIFWLRPLVQSYSLFNFKRKKTFAPINLFALLTLVWFLFIFISSIFTVKFYDRYLLPLFPLFAVLIAYAVVGAANEYRKYFRVTNVVMFFVVSFVLVLSAILSYRFEKCVIYFVGVVLLFIAVLFLFFRLRYQIKPEKLTVAFVLLFLCSLTLFIANFSLPTPENQIYDFLMKGKGGTPEKIVFAGGEAMAAKLRVACKGDVQVERINDSTSFDRDTLIFFRDDCCLEELKNYKIENIAFQWTTFPVHSMILNTVGLQENKAYYKMAVSLDR